VAFSILFVGWALIVFMVYKLNQDPTPAQRRRDVQRVVKEKSKEIDAKTAKGKTEKKNE
jgi:hypothetical protein